MNDSAGAKAPDAPAAAPYTLWQLVRYMLALGTWGFGGPVALVGYMYRDLVERRHWISESDYKEGLTLAQLMPGPLAAQLAIYLGHVRYHLLGATLAGLAFVLPSFCMVVVLGALYVAYGGIGWMQAVFYGVGAAVIGIIAMSAYKLTTKNIGKDKLLWAIFLVNAAVTVITKSEIVWSFLGAGVLVWLLRAPQAQWTGTGCWRSVRSSPMQAASFSAAASRSCRSSMAVWSRSTTGSRTASSSMRWPWR
jgi:chromate transporter